MLFKQPGPGLHPPPNPVVRPAEPQGSNITVASAPPEATAPPPAAAAPPPAAAAPPPDEGGVIRSESDGQVGQAGPAVLPIRSQSIPGNSTTVRLPPLPSPQSSSIVMGQKAPTILPPISNEPELNTAEDNPFMRAADAMEARNVWKEVLCPDPGWPSCAECPFS